jgi:uncharacterized protein
VAHIAVRVTPKAVRDETAGWSGSELCVRVTAPPEGEKASAAVGKVLASALGVPKSSVRLVRGETSRHKVFEIPGVDESQLHAVFGPPDTTLF